MTKFCDEIFRTSSSGNFFCINQQHASFFKVVIDPRIKDSLKRLVRISGFSGLARIVYNLRPSARIQYRKDKEELKTLGKQLVAIREQISALKVDQDRVALVIGVNSIPFVLHQLPILVSLKASGYSPVILLPSRFDYLAQRIYESCGFSRFDFWEDQLASSRSDVILSEFARCNTQDELLELTWENIAIGKFAVSTLMRRLRKGQIDLSDHRIRSHMAVALRRTLDHAVAGKSLIERWKPKIGVFIDRGYTPEGPLFEALIAAGVKPITYNTAHRDNRLMLKRYGPENSNVHPSSISAKTWNQLCKMPWTAAHWHKLRTELEDCYNSNQWYSEVGTQFKTSLKEQKKLIQLLGLDTHKKTVLLFPHIFWDATFFWGRDVFRDYEDWYRECVRVAWENDKVNWIIKVHPANLIKNQRDKINDRFSELSVLDEFGTIPDHITVLSTDTDISTHSLFSIGDVCLTVRGTVGIEAAMAGLTVLTAGTGRYDGLGFTEDIRTRESWCERLANLETVQTPSDRKVELARRYGYGVFLSRPLEMSSIGFHYVQKESAPLKVVLNSEAEQSILDCQDIKTLMNWLNGNDEDLVVTTTLDALRCE